MNGFKNHIFIKMLPYALYLGATITSLFYHTWLLNIAEEKIAYNSATTKIETDISYINSIARNGGLYGSISNKHKPDPKLLHVNNRDIKTIDGKDLTLISPANMTHYVGETNNEIGTYSKLININGEENLTSWEKRALELIKKSEVSEVYEISNRDYKEYAMLMRPVIAKNSCHSCHSKSKYKEGKVVGTISTFIPMEKYYSHTTPLKTALIYSHGIMCILGFLVINILNKRWRRESEKRDAFESEIFCQKEKAESANQAKNSFIARMSHDLRTPLNTIIGFAHLGTMQQDPEKNSPFANYFQHIEKSARHLLAIMNDLLNLSAIEADQIVLEKESIESAPFIHSIIESHQIKAKEKNIALSCQVKDNTHIYADRFRLTEIINNLLSNAIKYTPDGGKAGIELQDDDSNIIISVWDTGVGIDKKNHQLIFNEFEQLHYRKQKKGVGLGLAIVKRLVHLHSGTISIQSQPDKGSKFSFSIPLKGNI